MTQAWLAAGEDPRTDVSGEYFYHQQTRPTHPAAHDPRHQDALLDYCAALTATPCPGRDDRVRYLAGSAMTRTSPARVPFSPRRPRPA